MTLIDYTSYDAIRAVLGVSNDELEDGTLALELYSTNLQLELEDVDVLLPGQYVTVSALDVGSRTAVQQRFYLVTRLFATYSVAVQLCSSLPMFGPKDISDGKATTGRFADAPYRETVKEVQKDYANYRLRLSDAYAQLSAGSTTETTRKLFATSSLTTDPVVG